MNRNRWMKKILFVFCSAVLLLLMAFPTAAAGNKFPNFIQNGNTWYTANSAGKLAYVDVGDSNSKAYHKIYIPAQGRLQVTGITAQGYGMKVVLCNSKRETVELTAQGQRVKKGSVSAFYGVQKGTYYIRVSGQKKYALQAWFVQTGNTGGVSLKTAANLKPGGNYVSVMPATSTASYRLQPKWYKMALTVSGRIHLNYAVYGTGIFRVTVYNSKGQLIGSDTILNFANTAKSVFNLTQGYPVSGGKLPAGNYYVKIERGDKKGQYRASSGVYQLKWTRY